MHVAHSALWLAPCRKVASGPEETSGGWALVITDVESSSDISKKDPVAFGKVRSSHLLNCHSLHRHVHSCYHALTIGMPAHRTFLQDALSNKHACSASAVQIQAAHDMVMREGLSKYDGYEIITEGDSFHIAFTNVHNAVGFCLDVQSRLMDINWDTRILKLEECKMVTGELHASMGVGEAGIGCVQFAVGQAAPAASIHAWLSCGSHLPCMAVLQQMCMCPTMRPPMTAVPGVDDTCHMLLTCCRR